MQTSSQPRLRLIVFLLLLLQPLFDTTSAASDGKSKKNYVDKITDLRIRSQNLHVDAAEKRLAELEHELEELHLPNVEQELNRIDGRIRQIEKSPCEEKELVCGGDKHQCVHHLLVCDGHKDCFNGHDEDAKLCSDDLFRIGTTFRGVIRMRNRNFDTYTTFNDYVNIMVVSSRRSPFFRPHTNLRFNSWVEYGGDVSFLTWGGRYIHAKRQLIMVRELAGELPYVLVCDFDTVDDNRLVCTTYTEGSMDIVERGIYFRV